MSEFFKWDRTTLGVNVEEMDTEHIELIARMNALHKAYAQKKHPTSLDTLVKDFVTYTKKHFSDEEAYMERIQFEGLQSHKLIHEQLLKEVSKHVEHFEKTGGLSEAFFQFLSVWLSSHIRGIDTKYGKKITT